ncbi:MAG: T9SS type A sorting domain-containing protein [Ignavibacteriales bacterium]|nr:T9SS type A sorting domain-containing protein [Ignavibacteriales bacterium]
MRTFVGIGLVSLLAFPLLAAEKPEGEKKNTGQSLSKTGQTKSGAILNINNFTTWQRADGQGHNPPNAAYNGSDFPRGTSHPIYADGMVWGGKAYLNAGYSQAAPVQLIRVGGSTYNVGNQIGWIIGTGANAVAVASSDARARVYRIRRDYTTMAMDELRRDAAENNLTIVSAITDADIADVINQYEKDWSEWPVDLGAPYVERNGVAGYQKPPAFNSSFTVDSLIGGNYDEPGVAGSDPGSPANQVIWSVFNDLNRGNMLGFQGSEPMGIEGQLTLWAYKRSDALGNLYFKRLKLINKGGAVVNDQTGAKGYLYIDSMYVSVWSDPDLGYASDDLDGCDSLLSLAYTYNGNATDAEYAKFNLPPPAVGYDFLAGPAVPGSPTDTAVFNMKKKPGFKNLPMTSFCYFVGGGTIGDPPFTYEGALRWFRMFQGYVPDPSTSPFRKFPHPTGMTETFFPLSGDPVTGSGFLDGGPPAFSPGDRRLVLNTGPFRLAPLDTQEVVVGVVAGLGGDRLSSVAVLKANDRAVQTTYDLIFQVSQAPAAPLPVAAEMDSKVVIEWGSNAARVTDTETRVSQPGSYEFEGYNVYQLPSAGSRLSEGKRIATYDVINSTGVILDEAFDPVAGQILATPIQFGTNSGVKRFFVLDKDYVRDINKVYNGQEYYLAVTAYSRATEPGFVAALESAPIVLTVRPKKPFGLVMASSVGDSIDVSKAGASDGKAVAMVLSPASVTGDSYQVRFADDATWSVFNTTKNKTVVSGVVNQAGGEDYPIVDGVLVKVFGSPAGMKSWEIPAGTRRFSPVGGFTGLGLEGFADAGDPSLYDQDNGTIGMAEHFAFGGIGTTLAPAEYHTVLLKLAAVNNTSLWDPKATPTDENYSLAYRYMRNSTAAAADPSFAPWIINKASGYPYQDYNYAMPFSAWDIDVNPPVRLAVGVFENNVAGGKLDGRYWPGLTNESNSTIREFAFIFKSPYTTTPDPALAVNLFSNATTPLMWVMTCARRSTANWAAGDQFQINSFHPNSPAVTFSYNTAAFAPSKSMDLEKASIKRVGVFPNPYYAFNPAETNRFVRFVTFTNLPPTVKIRIFNLAGQLVRTLDKNDPSQFLRWDLNNENHFPVASGVYVAYVELTLSDGSVDTKVVKLGIIQEQEVPDVF